MPGAKIVHNPAATQKGADGTASHILHCRSLRGTTHPRELPLSNPQTWLSHAAPGQLRRLALPAAYNFGNHIETTMNGSAIRDIMRSIRQATISGNYGYLSKEPITRRPGHDGRVDV